MEDPWKLEFFQCQVGWCWKPKLRSACCLPDSISFSDSQEAAIWQGKNLGTNRDFLLIAPKNENTEGKQNFKSSWRQDFGSYGLQTYFELTELNMAVRVSKVVIPIPTWIGYYKTFFEFLNFILKKIYPSRHRLCRNKKRKPGNDDKDSGGNVGLDHMVGQLPGEVKLQMVTISLKVKVILTTTTTCNVGDGMLAVLGQMLLKTRSWKWVLTTL